MNTSYAISSTIDSVEFTSFMADEVRAISVKRIESPQTFDRSLRPIPCGLYDSALGAFGDSPCATCGLLQAACPGHPGHIELPFPVYHPIYMDLLLRLLRSQCCHCYRFRMRRKDLDAAFFKLRLLQFGLLDAASSIDGFEETVKAGSDDEDDDDVADRVTRARRKYLRKQLQKNCLTRSDIRRGKHEGAAQMRREVISALLRVLPSAGSRICATCKGISPTYRKDGFVKIFQKALSPKDRAKLIQSGFKLRDALLLKRKGGAVNRKEKMCGSVIEDIQTSSASDEDVEGQGESLEDDGDFESRLPKTRKQYPAAGQKYLTPAEIKVRMGLLFEKERPLLEVIFNSRPVPRGQRSAFWADSFFIETILVPPNKYRPEAKTGDRITEAQQNTLFSGILSAAGRCASVHRVVEGSATGGPTKAGDVGALLQAYAEMQQAVNSLIDSSKNPTQGAAGGGSEDGVKQKLEKKEGLFRMNMMGKRVNYAARSVISPDPNIETNEIGVPPVFARKLTYPEPVTSHNFKEMQQAVINGVGVWPGASAIQNENGQVINLAKKSQDERLALANELLAPSNPDDTSMRNKKVFRHLTNGDVVIMNRQPTLHKPSMMAHRVRVLSGEKTIRMHYANCKTYNADFDGDEMNLHFPQTEVARAEALNIADTDHQYLSGTEGKPLRGLIQDHLSISVYICSKDTFFNRYDYQQLVYAALRPEHGHIVGDRIHLLPPAILKPAPRWTGKQVVTTVLKNMTPSNAGRLWMLGDSQIKASAWGSKPKSGTIKSEPEPDEATVRFVDGELIHGILDKAHLGPSSGGFIHAVHEVYGPSVAGKLLSSLGRLLTWVLNVRAFTCGMDDLKLTTAGETRRQEALVAAQDMGLKVAADYVGLGDEFPAADDPELIARLEEVFRDDEKQKDLELLLNQACSQLSGRLTEACVPAGLVKQFPENQMQVMTISGAKGSGVNANLISSNLAQQVLEGRRVPLMVSGKSLPCFKPFETHIRAGGYIANRFLTGIRPQEYYFHHMAGREGLIDTAVKTATSGYLQRCLIKGMEGLRVCYDSTVRNSDGSLVQFLYGEDGLDPTKSKYLHDFRFTLKNVDSEVAKLKLSQVHGRDILDHRKPILEEMKHAIKHANDPVPSDPVNSHLSSCRYAYVTSEKFYISVMDFLKHKSRDLVDEKRDKGNKAAHNRLLGKKAAGAVLHAKYSRAAINPGEMVGIVAAQSIGEPSTQMTLNTFHLAGHSAKNVTLGVPRLRELLMTDGSSIKKPSMTLFLHKEMTAADGEQFAKAISLLPLGYVIDKIAVSEKLGTGTVGRAKTFDIKMDFFPSHEYAQLYAISIGDVLDTVETKFIPRLEAIVAKVNKKKDKMSVSVGESYGTVEVAGRRAVAEATGDDGDGDGGDDDEEEGDGDTTSVKNKANRSEAVSYGPNDEEDDAIQAANQRDLDIGEESETEDKGLVESSPNAGHVEDKVGVLSESRAERVKNGNTHTRRFFCDEVGGSSASFTLEYDPSMPKILMDSLVKDVIKKTVIQQIDKIGRCTFVFEDMKQPSTGNVDRIPLVHTAGVNLRAMQNYSQYIDPNKTTANDVAAMLEVYGVEACRSTIIQELSGTFSGHGISVDNRHLNLIGDWMTRNGEITPFNRTGLRGTVSPFAKMSFETTVEFLKDAVIDGDWDDLKAPSAKIVMGQHADIGTNCFDVISALVG